MEKNHNCTNVSQTVMVRWFLLLSGSELTVCAHSVTNHRQKQNKSTQLEPRLLMLSVRSFRVRNKSVHLS